MLHWTAFRWAEVGRCMVLDQGSVASEYRARYDRYGTACSLRVQGQRGPGLGGLHLHPQRCRALHDAPPGSAISVISVVHSHPTAVQYRDEASICRRRNQKLLLFLAKIKRRNETRAFDKLKDYAEALVRVQAKVRARLKCCGDYVGPAGSRIVERIVERRG